MKGYLVSAALIIAAFGCNKNNQDGQAAIFSGVYVEKAPIVNGSQLNFINSDNVIISVDKQLVNQSSTLRGYFKYQIANNKIAFISSSMAQSDTITYLFQAIGKDS